MKKISLNDFYGNFSSGSGYITPDTDDIKNILEKKKIKIYEKEIKKNILRMKINPSYLKNKSIMNVGSGREALPFLQFKPKRIFHYDISKINISRMKKYIKKNKLNEKISSYRLDLSKNELPKNKFDLIYLHGVIQHVDHPGKALNNLINSLKPNGYIWFYFYRSGSLTQFIAEIQRFLLKSFSPEKFLQTLKILNFNKNYKFINGMMDTAFAPNTYLYEPKQYINFLEKSGIEIFGNSFLFPKIKKKYDFINFHSSVILFCKKTKIKSYTNKKNLIKNLSPKHSKNQIDIKIYKENKIKKLIKKIKIFKIKNKNFKEVLFATAYHLETMKLKLVDKYFLNKKFIKNDFEKLLSFFYKTIF